MKMKSQSLVFDTKAAEDLENYDFDLDNSKDDVQLGSEIDPRLAVLRRDEYEPQMTEDRLRGLDGHCGSTRAQAAREDGSFAPVGDSE